jgi:hypothetical protein
LQLILRRRFDEINRCVPGLGASQQGIEWATNTLVGRLGISGKIHFNRAIEPALRVRAGGIPVEAQLLDFVRVAFEVARKIAAARHFPFAAGRGRSATGSLAARAATAAASTAEAATIGASVLRSPELARFRHW